MQINILLVTDGWVHPSILARFWLSYAITKYGYQYKRVRNLNEITNLNLDDFNCLVLYYHHTNLSDTAYNTLENYVESGGGVMAIHSVTASFMEKSNYLNLIGGRFLKHGPIEEFLISPLPETEDIFPGIRSFCVRDELYIHDLAPDINVHFTTLSDGEQVPIVWTRYHGAGRICYVVPGHRAASFRVNEFKQILINGIDWVCNLQI